MVGQALGAREELAHRRLDGGQLGTRALLVAEEIEEDTADLVLRSLVPCRGQGPVGAVDGRRHLVTVADRENGQEEIVSVAGDVAPARGALLVHGHGVAVDPEEVQGEIAQEIEAPLVAARLHAGGDVRLRGRLLLEVTLDDGGELLEGLEGGEVQLREEVEGEDDTAVAVDHEWLHGAPSESLGGMGLGSGADRARSVATGQTGPPAAARTPRAGRVPRRSSRRRSRGPSGRRRQAKQATTSNMVTHPSGTPGAARASRRSRRETR